MNFSTRWDHWDQNYSQLVLLRAEISAGSSSTKCELGFKLPLQCVLMVTALLLFYDQAPKLELQNVKSSNS